MTKQIAQSLHQSTSIPDAIATGWEALRVDGMEKDGIARRGSTTIRVNKITK